LLLGIGKDEGGATEMLEGMSIGETIEAEDDVSSVLFTSGSAILGTGSVG
jgi:hypothetical protein